MSDRLPDERVQELTAPTYATAPQYDDVVALAREVQERRAADTERDALQAENEKLRTALFTDGRALRAKVNAIDALLRNVGDGTDKWAWDTLVAIQRIIHPEQGERT